MAEYTISSDAINEEFEKHAIYKFMENNSKYLKFYNSMYLSDYEKEEINKIETELYKYVEKNGEIYKGNFPILGFMPLDWSFVYSTTHYYPSLFKYLLILFSRIYAQKNNSHQRQQIINYLINFFKHFDNQIYAYMYEIDILKLRRLDEDVFENLTPLQVLQRIHLAIDRKDYDAAAVLLGVFHSFNKDPLKNPKENNYKYSLDFFNSEYEFENYEINNNEIVKKRNMQYYFYRGLIQYLRGNYLEAIEYLDKAKCKEDPNYLKFECFAKTGNYEELYKATETEKQYRPLMYNLVILHLLFETLRNFCIEKKCNIETLNKLNELLDNKLNIKEIPNNKLNETYIFKIISSWQQFKKAMEEFTKNNDMEEISDGSYSIPCMKKPVYKIFNLLIDLTKEIIERLEVPIKYPDFDENFGDDNLIENTTAQIQDDLERLKIILKLYNPNFVKIFDISLETIKEENIVTLKEKSITHFSNFYKEHKLKDYDKNIESLEKYLMFILRINCTKIFIEEINKNFSFLAAKTKDGYTNAENLLKYAYVECVLTEENDLKQKILSLFPNLDKDKEIKDSSKAKAVLKCLTKRGQIAYEHAEDIFLNSQKEIYGYKDAGLIAFGYARIIEIYLSEKIVLPLLDKIGYDKIINLYESIKHLETNDNKIYEKGWKQIIDSYTLIKKGKIHSFMLGNIQYFFRNIKKPMTKDPDKDLLFIEINNNLCKILNQQGIQEFREKNDCFSEIVSRKKIETFRNPPAHTNYLPYKIACQCRDYFNDMILRIDSMLLS